MRTNLKMVVLAAMLMGAGRAVAAQETPRTRAEAVLPADIFARIDATARAAEADGIPGDILYNKALEGMAKHVPSDLLAPAVQAYAERLQVARDAFGAGEIGGPLLVAGADALQRGVRPELLSGLGEGRGRSPMAVLVLADLVEAGVPDDQALSLVREAMRRGARDQQMLDMPGEVRRLMRDGQSARGAVDQLRRSMWGGRGSGGLPPVAPGAEPMGRHQGGGA